MVISRRDRFIYFGIAFFTYLLFKYVIGPYAGLRDGLLTVGSYLFAIAASTGYLYIRLLPSEKRTSGDD